MCRRFLSVLFAVLLLLGLTLPAAWAQPDAEASATGVLGVPALPMLLSAPSSSSSSSLADTDSAAPVEVEPASPAEAIDPTPLAAGLVAAVLPLRHISPVGEPSGVPPAPFLAGLLRPPSRS